jgi:dTDP-4-amino-4,6-dideoxygalactose transaminase
MVAVPDFTFAATANAVIHAGARPLFVDVAEDSWAMDPACLARALDVYGDAVRAVVPVHALGHPADMDSIAALGRERGIPIIEDAAGAIGARYRGRAVGGLGDAGIFSFNGNKTVTTGGGGGIVTDRRDWGARARSLSSQAREGNAYRYREAGFNYRMPNLNAALGLAQLERLDEMIEAKRAIAARYDAALEACGDLRPMPRAAWGESSCWLYSVRCAGRRQAESLIDHLGRAGIEARLGWESLSAQAPYAAYERVLNGVSESLSGCVVSLPCSSSLGAADQARVITALERVAA